MRKVLRPRGFLMAKGKRFAVSYLRFSSKRQEKGSSVDRQKERLDAYLARHPEVTLVDEKEDRGVSGFRGKHAKTGRMSELLEAMERGDYPQPLTIIVESIDRLSREGFVDAWALFTRIIAGPPSRKGSWNVSLVFLDVRDGVELTPAVMNSDQGLVYQIIGAMMQAHAALERKSVWVKSAWNRNIRLALAEGRGIKGYVGPPWVSIDKKSHRYVLTEKDLVTAATVARIFEWAADGTSPHSIAKRLNELKVPEFRAHMPKRRERQGWYQPYVATLLRNRQVLGEHRFRDGEVIEGYFPQVVTPELFHRVQQRLDGVRRQGKPGAKGRTFSNLFTHMAKCACCGGSMEMTVNRLPTADGPEPIKYLASSNKKRRKGCTSSGGINYPKLEHAVLDALPFVPWSDIVREENPNDPLPALDESIARESIEIERLTKATKKLRLMVEDDVIGEDFKADYATRMRERAEASARLEQLQVDRARIAQEWANRPGLVTTAIGYRDAMASASEAEQFAIRERLVRALREMITEMVVDLPTKRVTITYGDRWELHIAMPIRRAPMVSHRWTVDLTGLPKPEPAFIDFVRKMPSAPEMRITRIR